MSARLPKATELLRRREMTRGAISRQSAAQQNGLFDHLVGDGEHARRDC